MPQPPPARRPPYLNFSMKYRGLYPHMYLQANDDFINIMNHRAVAYEFLFDFYEVKTWLSLITYFQGWVKFLIFVFLMNFKFLDFNCK